MAVADTDDGSLGILRVQCDDSQHRDVQMPLLSIRRSGFFSSFLDSLNTVTIVSYSNKVTKTSDIANVTVIMPIVFFPQQYNDIVNLYLMCIAGDTEIVNYIANYPLVKDKANLGRLLQLCHYLEDDYLFEHAAIPKLLSDYSNYFEVIASLHDDLLYNIALQLPYQMALDLLKLEPASQPVGGFNTDCSDDNDPNSNQTARLLSSNFFRNFFRNWLKLNNGKSIVVKDRSYKSGTRKPVCYEDLVSRHQNLPSYYSGSDVVEFYTRISWYGSRYNNSDSSRHGIQQLWLSGVQLHDTLLFTGSYCEGCKDGKFLYWDKEGKLIREENYKRGLLHGLCIEHDQAINQNANQNAGMTTKSHYDNNKLVSKTVCCDYGLQQIRSQTIINGDDSRTVKYNSNGKLEFELVKQNGVQHNHYYDKQGHLTTEDYTDHNYKPVLYRYTGIFSDGKSKAFETSNLITGRSIADGPSADGLPFGNLTSDSYTKTYWYKSGYIISHYHYLPNDVKHGECYSWYDVALPVASTAATNTMAVSTTVINRPEDRAILAQLGIAKVGQLHHVRDYYYGKADGQWLEWYPDGQLRRDYFYERNKRHGLCQEWWPNGDLRYASLYDQHVFVESLTAVMCGKEDSCDKSSNSNSNDNDS